MIRSLVTAEVLAALALAILVGPSTVHADKVLAEELFQQARAFTSQDRWAEACPRFEGSLREEWSLGTAYYLADCYEHVGRLASAWAQFTEVAARASAEPAKRDKAKERAAALRPKLATVVIETDPSLPGLKISRRLRAADGTTITSDVPLVALGTPIPIDAGTLTVIAEAEGRRAREVTLTVRDGERLGAVVPTLAVIPPTPVSSDRSATGARFWSTPRLIAGGGVAVGVGIGVAGFFLRSGGVRDRDAIEARGCSPGSGACSEEERAGYRSADGRMRTGTFVLAGGIGLAVISGVAIALLPPKAAASVARHQPQLVVGAEGLGLAGRF
jgi:hypothetical protein